jgi:hypothetical protein
MQKGLSTESQILVVLRQAEGGRLEPDLCRERGICTVKRWPRKRWRSVGSP